MNALTAALNMSDIADDPYRVPTEEELAHLPGNWYHAWLLDSIKQGDIAAIKRYLNHKPGSLHEGVPSLYDPFVVTAQQPDPTALHLLLEHWEGYPTQDAPPPDARGVDPLLNVACTHGALETARYLLDEQPALADLHARDGFGYTPILGAAKSLVSCAVSEAVMEGVRVDALTARERVHRSLELMDLLLDRGACASDSWNYGAELETDHSVAVDGDDRDKDTVLSLAISRAGPTILRRLIEAGADALATTSSRPHDRIYFAFMHTAAFGNVTLMHLAAFYGNRPAIQVLVEHYAQRGLDLADVLACRDHFGRLPIHYAAAGWPRAPNGDTTDTSTLLRILTDSGNPRFVNAVDRVGETPLHYAVSPEGIAGQAGALLIPQILCTQLHASAKLRGRGGETALHRLSHCHYPSSPEIIHQRLEVARMLLSLGDGTLAADIAAVDNGGNTPLHFAAQCCLPHASYLLAAGANVRIRNFRGQTPVHKAAAGVSQIILEESKTMEEMMQEQDAMLAALCGKVAEEEGGLALEKNWSALMDEEDLYHETPRQIVEETRESWREQEEDRARVLSGVRGRGREGERGRGRGRGRGG